MLRGETESGVRSFLHSSKHSELWSGALSPQDHLDTSGREYLQQIIIRSSDHGYHHISISFV